MSSAQRFPSYLHLQLIVVTRHDSGIDALAEVAVDSAALMQISDFSFHTQAGVYNPKRSPKRVFSTLSHSPAKPANFTSHARDSNDAHPLNTRLAHM